jgi:hypothetical protein
MMGRKGEWCQSLFFSVRRPRIYLLRRQHVPLNIMPCHESHSSWCDEYNQQKGKYTRFLLEKYNII